MSTYAHKDCDTAIIENRDKDACDGCRAGVRASVVNPAPTWADLPQGCYPTMTGGMTPEDHIARGRGNQGTELRAEVVLLRDENDRLRTQINRDAKEYDRIIGTMGAEHLRNRGALSRELTALRAELAVVTDERDQALHELAVTDHG